MRFASSHWYAIARPIDNPYLDRFLCGFRERTGQQVLTKKGDYDRVRELLAAGAAVATLGDQDAGQRGLFVDFFGRPASTHKAMALLCLEHQVPIMVIGTLCGVMASLPQPMRLPRTMAPTRPATPELMCTTVPPA